MHDLSSSHLSLTNVPLDLHLFYHKSLAKNVTSLMLDLELEVLLEDFEEQLEKHTVQLEELEVLLEELEVKPRGTGGAWSTAGA